jgi:hypothetical protein
MKIPQVGMVTMTMMMRLLQKSLLSFVAIIGGATTGTKIIDNTQLIPNSSPCYGHSTTTNVLIEIMICHLLYWERSSIIYTVTVKNGKKTIVCYKCSLLLIQKADN